MIHPGVLLKAHGLRASKRRGQNFLVHPATALAIAQSAGITKQDVVVEIGAGLGALTLALAALARRVISLEVDRGIFAVLSEVLAQEGADNVELMLADALKTDWAELGAKAGGQVVVAGNLPYAICSPLLFSLLKNLQYWRAATFMVQQEVAERLLAGPGGKEYGRLSVSVQTWCEIRPGFKVAAEQFFPRPAVESRLVHLNPRENPLVEMDEELAPWFEAVVRASFGQRRKTLLNSLAGGLGKDKAMVGMVLERAGIDPRRRAETLTPQELGRISRGLAGH